MTHPDVVWKENDVKISSRGLFAISLIFSLSVIFIVFGATFTEETIQYILSFNLIFLILAIGFRILALALWGLRIVLMSRSLGYHVGFFYSLNMVLAGLLAGTITPGQAGGEPVRVHEPVSYTHLTLPTIYSV